MSTLVGILASAVEEGVMDQGFEGRWLSNV